MRSKIRSVSFYPELHNKISEFSKKESMSFSNGVRKLVDLGFEEISKKDIRGLQTLIKLNKKVINGLKK